MNITIVGTGRIGAGLGRAWAKAGHRIVFAVRDPDDPTLASLLAETGAQALHVPEALSDSTIVALAMPFAAMEDVARALPDWRGRIVIDCTNAIGPGFSLLVGHTDSGAEINARRLPGATVVKCFTAQGAENLSAPEYDGVAATNFYCGDDEAAKATVKQLVVDVGMEPMDLGPLSAARFLEPMTLVWFAASKAVGSRQIAFKILRRHNSDS